MPSSFAVESLRCMKLSMHLLAKSSCGDCIVAKHDGFHIVEGQDVKAVHVLVRCNCVNMQRPPNPEAAFVLSPLPPRRHPVAAREGGWKKGRYLAQ